MRTIFFKLTTLLQQPILPVFVFDGPDKPRMKRGARVAGKFGTHDRRSVEFKRLLDECGLAYWNVRQDLITESGGSQTCTNADI